MSWWGKIIGGGFGFLVGGPLGAMLGASFGHQFDKGVAGLDNLNVGDPQRTQAAFFSACFSMMGYLAKADGHVSREEINLARQVMDQMNLNDEQRKAAIELFNQGKSDGFPLDEVLEQFRLECQRRRNLAQMFMEILISTAMADGKMDVAEKRSLIYIGEKLHFNQAQLEQLINMVAAQQHYSGPQQTQASLDDAYALLGIATSSSDAEVKKAYRRLMSQHHPDKLVSKGLPEEMIKLATEKTQEIKAAYEQIKAARK